MQRFFRILSDGVERFEGFVDKFTGDGIMALFGAPIAHEDHAQRACYAALHLRDEIARYATEVKREHDVGFSTRMGINSGEVVVGKIGDDLRMDYTAQGHTVGLAQRMESLAEPNTCYLSAATAQLVAGFFALDDLGTFQVKGVSAPVGVCALRGAGTARSRFDVARARGLSSFVGRDADMQALDAALEQARAGNGQVVGIVAAAGTGKSRLCFEFLERCRGRGLTVNVGRAVAHGKNIPFLPMLEAFRSYYGITDADPDLVVREKIAGRLLLTDASFRELLPVVFEFFGVPDPQRPVPRMDPEAKQRQLFAVLRKEVREGNAGGQLVTLIEDLHWIDAGGNPFFTEEVVQSLIESGALEGTRGSYRLVRPIARLQVPPTVQALLAARIDRLGEREKHVLQAAAVIGKDFPEPILSRVLGEIGRSPLSGTDLATALRLLKAAEFIYEESLYPVAEYAFKHLLTQEVALRSQLQEPRRRTHAAVARALEAAHADRLDETAALLAHHCAEAGRTFDAAQWHARAAGFIAKSDFAESARHWQKTRELLRTVADEPGAAALGVDACFQGLALVFRIDLQDEEADRVFQEGLGWATRTGDALFEGRMHQAFSVYEFQSHHIDSAIAHAAEWERIARARVAADDTLTFCLRIGARIDAIQAALALSRALRVDADAAALVRIEEVLETADRLIAETGACNLSPFVLVERAALSELRGERQQRQTYLRRAHDAFTQMGASSQAARLAREFAS